MSHRKSNHLPRREPSGRLSRATEDKIDAISPAAAKRLFDDAIRGRADPQFGTTMARLFMDRKLTPVQFETGRRWERLTLEYWRCINAPLPWPPPGPIASLGTVPGHSQGEDPPVNSKEGRRLREQRERFKAEHESAIIAIGNPLLVDVLYRVCIQGEAPVGMIGLENLRYGLDRLARHWRLVK